ncbi:MAG: hypothetical protein LAT63_00175 [Marinobacter sp.]|nr:hypothetical protein [Marinobacter sp.]
MAPNTVSSKKTKSQNPFWIGVILVATGVGLALLSIWIVAFTHDDYRSLLSESAPILLQRRGNSAFYMMPLIFLALIMLGLFCIAISIRKRKFSASITQKADKVFSTLLIAGFLGIFVGGYLGNQYWSASFVNAGYSLCQHPSGVTAEWLTDVWVDNTGLCQDQDVLRKLRSHRYTLDDVNHHIQSSRVQGSPPSP